MDREELISKIVSHINEQLVKRFAQATIRKILL